MLLASSIIDHGCQKSMLTVLVCSCVGTLDLLSLCAPRLLVQVCGGHGRCLGTVAGYCQCDAGYTGAACAQCASGYVARGRVGVCVFLPGALSSCSDGVRNGQEEGVDCGAACGTYCTHVARGRGFALVSLAH